MAAGAATATGGGAVGDAAAVGAAAGMAAIGAIGLEPPAGRGEERRTRGLKTLPPRVFTILEPKQEKNGGRGA